MFSPLRAVMFWNGDYKNKLVRLAMLEYIYKPLGMTLPMDDKLFARHVDAVFDYATLMGPLMFEKDILAAIRTTPQPTQSRAIRKPGFRFWKLASKYSTLSIETVAASKSKDLSGHVADAEAFDNITPKRILGISELSYSEDTLRFIHDLSYRRYHENPVVLTRSLVKYMNGVTGTPTQNIHVSNLLRSMVKAHQKSLACKLVLRARKLHGASFCLGVRNKRVKRLLETFTVKMCPSCCKPVNVVTKKKSPAGAAHRSHIFTDDYTDEVLYCLEKSNRGIMSYPLVSIGDDGVAYANDLEWTINGGLTKVFSVELARNPPQARMVIRSRPTNEMYTPVSVELDACGNCMVCCNK